MIGTTSFSAIFILRIIVTKIRLYSFLLLLIASSCWISTASALECFRDSIPTQCTDVKLGCQTTLYFNTTSYSELVKKTSFLNESSCVKRSFSKCEKLLNGTILKVDCTCATDLCNDVNQSAWNKKFSDLLDDFLATTAKTTKTTTVTTTTKTARRTTIPARSTTTRTAIQQIVRLTQRAGSITTSLQKASSNSLNVKQKIKYSKAPRAISTAAVFRTVKYVFGEPENNCPIKVFWLRVSFGICGFCFVYVLVCWIRNVVINHRYQQNHEKKKAERKRLEEQRRAEKENAPPEERPFRRRKRLLTDLDKQVLKAKKAKWNTFEELLGILDTEMEKLRKPESESAKEPKTEEIPQKPKGKPVEADPFVEKEDETQKSSVAE